MDFNEEKFQAHLKEIVAAGEVDGDRPLTLSELKELANSMGLTDGEWHELLVSADHSLTLAKNHLENRNYVDAVESANKATAINPYIKDGNSVLAQAYLMLWMDDFDPIQKEKAEFYARKELLVDTEDKLALSVLSTLQNKKRITRNDQNMRKKILVGIGVLVLLVVVVFISRSGSSSSVGDQLIELEEEVNAKMELVYTAISRRNNLIPEIMEATGKEASSIRIEINQLQNEISNSSGEQKMQLELTLEKKISQAKGLINSSTAKSNLIIEIEGAENRISFARNEYNEAVKHYNILVKKNKDSFEDTPLKPYYK